MTSIVALTRSSSRRTSERILKLLSSKSYTSAALVKEVSLAKNTVNSHLRTLIELRQVYISKWVYNSELDPSERKIARPVYRAGNKRSVARPDKMTGLEHSREYRKRRKANPEKYARAVRTRKLKATEERITKLTSKLKEQGATNPIEAMVAFASISRKSKK